MFNFTKLNDPEFKAKMKEKREAEQKASDELDKKINDALMVCEQSIETLEDKERSLVRSVRSRFNSIGIVSDAQLKWLYDIEKKLTEKLDEQRQATMGGLRGLMRRK